MSIAKRLHAIRHFQAKFDGKAEKPYRPPTFVLLPDPRPAPHISASGPWDWEHTFPRPRLEWLRSQGIPTPYEGLARHELPRAIGAQVRSFVTDLRVRADLARMYVDRAPYLRSVGEAVRADEAVSEAARLTSIVEGMLARFAIEYGESAAADLRVYLGMSPIASAPTPVPETSQNTISEDCASVEDEPWGPYPIPSETLSGGQVHNDCAGRGCRACRMTGYRTMARPVVERMNNEQPATGTHPTKDSIEPSTTEKPSTYKQLNLF